MNQAKFAKLLTPSFLAEIYTSPSKVRDCKLAKRDRNVIKHSEVFKNLLDLAREDTATDNSSEGIYDINFSVKATNLFVNSTCNFTVDLTTPKEELPSNKKPIDPLALFQSSGDERKTGTLNTLPYSQLIFSPKSPVSREEFLKYLKKLQTGLKYCTDSLGRPSQTHIESKKNQLCDVLPQEEGKKKTLALDLDGTLIWSGASKEDPDAFPVEYFDDEGQKFVVYTKFRPYLKIFLESLSSVYDIIVFTAAASFYAKVVVKLIDPESKYFRCLLTRKNCLQTKKGLFIKDLRILDRDLKNIVIIDDLVHSFGFQLDNGIPIFEFKGSMNDDELIYLEKYLHQAAELEDIREINRTHLKLKELLKMDVPKRA